MSMLALLLAWAGWEAAGWCVARFGWSGGALLQQAVLFALWLSVMERLMPKEKDHA